MYQGDHHELSTWVPQREVNNVGTTAGNPVHHCHGCGDRSGIVDWHHCYDIPPAQEKLRTTTRQGLTTTNSTFQHPIHPKCRLLSTVLFVLSLISYPRVFLAVVMTTTGWPEHKPRHSTPLAHSPATGALACNRTSLLVDRRRAQRKHTPKQVPSPCTNIQAHLGGYLAVAGV